MDDYEPMDVDVSSSSASKIDISCDDIDLSIVKKEKNIDEKEIIGLDRLKNFIKLGQGSQKKYTLHMSSAPRMPPHQQTSAVTFKYKNVKRHNINLDHNKKKKKKSHGLTTWWSIGSLIILIISIITYHIIGYKCIEELDLQLIKDKLSTNLYGQVEAVNDILKALEINEKSKILVFYGSTGVGKTYAVSMILENLLSSSNVYHFTMPSFTDNFSTEYLFGLTVCNNSLIVVDDLTIKDKNIKYHIEDIIDKSKDLGKSMTIILVYNCDIVKKGFNKKCDEEFLHTLKQRFYGIKAEKYYIKFNKLTLDHLIQCIVKEVKNRGLLIDEMLLAEILIHFDVAQDGCKSVHSKINFLTSA